MTTTDPTPSRPVHVDAAPDGPGNPDVPRLRPDAWLTATLGIPCLVAEVHTRAAARMLAAGLPLPGPRSFLTIQAPACTPQDLAPLLAKGAFIADTRVTLSGSITQGRARSGRDPRTADVRLREACDRDRTAVCDLAAGVFTCSRFHRDPRLGPEAGARIKRAWTDAWFTGHRGDAMIVAEDAHGPAGFLLALRLDGTLVVDLIAVAPHRRGCGIAGAMTRAAAEHLRCRAVRLGTQAVNTASIRAGESMGLHVERTIPILHVHGT